MQLNDAVPERRNLIVFCMATIVFFIGGGDACGEVKLPFGGIILTNHNGLIVLYWAIFAYLVLRYWSIFKSIAYDEDSKNGFQKRKNWKVALLETITLWCDTSKLPIPNIWYHTDALNELSYAEALEKIDLSETDVNIELAITTKTIDNKEDIFHLILVIKNEKKRYAASIRSEKVNIGSFRYGSIFLISLLKRMFSDKYLFDWVFPWLILLVTLLTIVGASFAFDYSLCPPAPLLPGQS